MSRGVEHFSVFVWFGHSSGSPRMLINLSWLLLLTRQAYARLLRCLC